MPVIGYFENPEITMKTDLEYTPSSFIDIQAGMDFSMTSECVVEIMRLSKSENTKRTYRSQWVLWIDWCKAKGVNPVPADPVMVAEYPAYRSESVSAATVRMALAAINVLHDLGGHTIPGTLPVVKTVMQDIARKLQAGNQKQARALDAEAVAAIRGSINDKADLELKSAETMALVQMISDSGLRRSELAALTWGDIEVQPDGSGRILVAKSKTDQTVEGASIAITGQAVSDLDRVAELRGSRNPNDSVFGICDKQISRRIALAAKAAGLGEGFSGHSGRVGCAVRMTRNGAPVSAVCRQGRWSSARMVNRYTRNESAGEALRYL